MNRRALVLGLSALAATRRAWAQRSQPGKPYRIAAIMTTAPVADMAGVDPTHPMMRGFVHELRALGYVEGRNLILERRSALGRPERYPEIVAELVALKCDVIVTSGLGLLIVSAKKVWGSVPIVMFASDDPVRWGLAASLGHPGGNVTGQAYFGVEGIGLKRLQLLKEAIPTVSRVAFLATKKFWEGLGGAAYFKQATASLGIEVVHAEHKPNELEATFAAIERMRPDALVVSGGTESFGQRQQIVEFARKARLPDSYPSDAMVAAGGLMSYGASLSGLGRGAAHFVDKILKGARPGDLPVEQPATYDLVINLKRAKALGLTVPQSILFRADSVIE